MSATPSAQTPALLQRRNAWCLAGALGFILVALYWNGMDAPLLFDDAGAITHNESIRQLSTALFPPPDGSTTTGRPVLNLSFALNYALTGESVRGLHAGNVLIHAAAAVLLFCLMRAVLLRPGFQSAVANCPEPVAFAIALLWGIHPLLTESVVCIAQRSESLCALFYLGALVCFAKAAVRPAEKRRFWYVATVVVSSIGMAAKEVMVTAPLMVLLFDRTFYAGNFANAWRERRGFYLALAGSWSVLAIILVAGGGTRGTSAGLGLGIGAWPYLLKQAEAIVLYLRLSMWPSPLVLDYGTAVFDSLGAVWWQASVVIALLLGTGWALWKRPAAGLAGAWCFVILAPSSSFVPLVSQTMAEHRMYLPLAGVIAAVVILGRRLLGRWGYLGFAGVAVLFGAMTVMRVDDYRTVIGIWQDSVTKYPQSARAQLNLGVELLAEKRWSEARGCFEQAVALSPGYALAHYNCGIAYQAEGRLPEALGEYEIAVRLAPANPDMRVNLGNALVESGRAAEAVPHYQEASRLKPAADIHFNLGQALTRLNRPNEAAAELELAVRLEPSNAKWRREMALWYAQRERWREATEHLQTLIALEPNDADAHANLGNVLLLAGRPGAAVGEYEAALRLRPGDTRLVENLRLARESVR